MSCPSLVIVSNKFSPPLCKVCELEMDVQWRKLASNVRSTYLEFDYGSFSDFSVHLQNLIDEKCFAH